MTDPIAIVAENWRFTTANIPTASGIFTCLQLSVRGPSGHVHGDDGVEYHFPPDSEPAVAYIILGGDGKSFVNSLQKFVTEHPEVLWTGEHDQ